MYRAPPFSTGTGLIRFIEGTLARKKDMWIANEGGEGTGKSTTSGNIAKVLKPGFSMRRDSIKDLDHLLQVLHDCVQGQLYVLDEAVNIFHNQDWAKWESKELSKIIRQMRIMKSVWILNQPDFDGMHPYVRNVRIPIRIYHPDEYEDEWSDNPGMTNGPPMVLWRQRYFSFKEQRVVYRWNRAIDELHVDKLDDEPEWEGYEEDKIQNFKVLVEGMMHRRGVEAAKERRAAAKVGFEEPPLHARQVDAEVL
jgi:hypothetical protein